MWAISGSSSTSISGSFSLTEIVDLGPPGALEVATDGPVVEGAVPFVGAALVGLDDIEVSPLGFWDRGWVGGSSLDWLEGRAGLESGSLDGGERVLVAVERFWVGDRERDRPRGRSERRAGGSSGDLSASSKAVYDERCLTSPWPTPFTAF